MQISNEAPMSNSKQLSDALTLAGIPCTTYVLTPEQVAKCEEIHQETVRFFKEQDEQKRRAMEYLKRNLMYFK